MVGSVKKSTEAMSLYDSAEMFARFARHILLDAPGTYSLSIR